MTELFFKGKEFVYNHHLAVPHRPLVADATRSVGAVDLSGNLIIQGDNLHALKSLLPHYAGRVDCIFIDPPYNTGNEGWRYNDKVNAPMIKAWLDENPVGVEDSLRHDKWCAMMWPRLKLLHELLAEDGSFWMTLDDNESHRGKLLLDEIFGEENFVTNVVWQKKYSPQNDAKWFSDNHDHLLVYAKTKEDWRPNLLPRSKEMDARYKNPDNDPKGSWKLITLHAKSGKDQDFEYTFSNGVKWSPPHGTYPRFSLDTLKEYDAQGKIWFGKDGKSIPSVKNYLSEVKGGLTPLTVWEHNLVGHNHEAKTELKGILDANPFDTPKPTRLLSQILRIATDKDALILDSFAGSGTTAHAVLKANAEDGGNRKFIMVEMEEDIADSVTAERMRRVIIGYLYGDKTTDGLGGTFTFCTLGDAIDLNRILSGATLPEYKTLAPVLFHMATNETLDVAGVKPDKHYVGATEHEVVWMIYQSNLDWLKSDAAALTLSKAKEIAATDPKKDHLVFAPARFVSQKVLKEENLKVKFVPFPDALYQIEREGE